MSWMQGLDPRYLRGQEDKRIDNTPTEIVYGNLIVAFRQAHYHERPDLAQKIDVAIRLLEELWPEDCARWRERYSTEK